MDDDADLDAGFLQRMRMCFVSLLARLTLFFPPIFVPAESHRPWSVVYRATDVWRARLLHNLRSLKFALPF